MNAYRGVGASYAEGTAREWDRICDEAAAREEQDRVEREFRQARAKLRPHRFVPDQLMPEFCDACGVRDRYHGDAS